MIYLYLLSWVSVILQASLITLSIGIFHSLTILTKNKFSFWILREFNFKSFLSLKKGAGLFYLAEIVEEYAYAAKKIINYTILVSYRSTVVVNQLIYQFVHIDIGINWY